MTIEELKKQVLTVTKIDRTAFVIFALAMVGGMICIPFTKSYNIPGAIMIAVALVFFVLHIICLSKLNKYEAELKDLVAEMKQDKDDGKDP